MLKNYFLISFRSFLKKPAFTLILLFGLASGLTATFLLFLYIDFEISYDKYHPRPHQLYRVYTANYDEQSNTYTYLDAMSFNLSGPTLKNEFAEIEAFARVLDLADGINFKIGEKIVQEKEAMFADAGFADLFDIQWLQGSNNAFSKTYSIVMTEKAANKYFGKQNPMNQIIEVTTGQFQGVYEVNGIIKNTPTNTHLYFDVLISYPTLWQSSIEPNWNNFGDYTYFRIKEGADIEALNEKLFPLSKKYLGENTTLRFRLQPVKDIHLHSNMAYEAEINGDANTVYFLLIIGIFILVIAWINYINLITAKAMERAREVGMRKSVGANRFSLVKQFMIEAALLNFLALLLALGFTYALIPWFTEFTGITIVPINQNEKFLLLCFAVLIVSIFLSGFYPAIVQSSYKPSLVLKGNFSSSNFGLKLRKALVVFQFTASLFLIAGTFIINRQVQHMRNEDKGMNLDQVMIIPTNTTNFDGDSLSDDRYRSFRNAILQWEEVKSVSTSSSIPAGAISNISSISGGVWWDKSVYQNQYTYYVAHIDDAFIPTYKIELLAGRNFSEQRSADTGLVVIINEAARKLLEFPDAQQAIDEFIEIPSQSGRHKYRVVGVIGNFHRQSLKHKVEPTLYFYNGLENGSFYSLKINSQDYHHLINNLAEVWTDHYPLIPFDYFFADDVFDQQYSVDRQFGQVFSLFSLLAVIIAGLGLYGLAYYVAINKTKEIGIRKSLGASVFEILLLLFKRFIKLAVVAFIVNVPIVWFVMNRWLSSYASHTEIEWWILAGAGLTMLVIILVTVGYHTLKAARMDPVAAIRTE